MIAEKKKKNPLGSSLSFLPRDREDIFNILVERITERERDKGQIKKKVYCSYLKQYKTHTVSINHSEDLMKWHCCRNVTLGYGQSTVCLIMYFSWELSLQIHKSMPIRFVSRIIPLVPPRYFNSCPGYTSSTCSHCLSKMSWTSFLEGLIGIHRRADRTPPTQARFLLGEHV